MQTKVPFQTFLHFVNFFSLSRPQSKIIIHSQEILNFEILFVAFFSVRDCDQKRKTV